MRRNDVITLKVVNGAGSIAEFDFTVKGDSAIANGWNPAIFGAPTAAAPISLGVCEVKHEPTSALKLLTRFISYKNTKTSRSNTVSKTKSATKTTSSRTISKPAKGVIVRALKKNKGNQTATAAEFAVSPRTLGRWLNAYSL